MSGKQVTKFGRFEVATAPSVMGGFYGWAKGGSIVADDPVREPGEPVWFNFGSTRDEVTAKLLREIDEGMLA